MARIVKNLRIHYPTRMKCLQEAFPALRRFLALSILYGSFKPTENRELAPWAQSVRREDENLDR